MADLQGQQQAAQVQQATQPQVLQVQIPPAKTQTVANQNAVNAPQPAATASPAPAAPMPANTTASVQVPASAPAPKPAPTPTPVPATAQSAPSQSAPATEPPPEAKAENPKLKMLQDSILAANIPQMVMMSISYALDMRSSDIHIEPLENLVRVRFRIDGVLMHIVEYPKNLHPEVVSRVKIMSNLKID